MVVAVLLSLLFIIVISFILIFIFYVLLPSLEKQGIPSDYPLISESEIFIEDSQEEEITKGTGKKAIVLCSSSKNLGEKRFNYSGPKNCALFFSLFDTEFDCKHNCIGFGDCIKVCPVDAIFIENGCAVVSDICQGCAKCVSVCPNNCIRLVSSSNESTALCGTSFSEKTNCKAFPSGN